LKLAEHLASVLCVCFFPVVSRCPSYSQLSVFENAFCFQHGIDHRWDWMLFRSEMVAGMAMVGSQVGSGRVLVTSCPGPMFLDQFGVELASGKHTKNYGTSAFYPFYSWVNQLFLLPCSIAMEYGP
jgi:hypothetical protein